MTYFPEIFFNGKFESRDKFPFHSIAHPRSAARSHRGRFSVFCFQIERIILLRFKSSRLARTPDLFPRCGVAVSQTRLGVHIMYDMCTHECGNTARGAHIYHFTCVCVLRRTHRQQNIIRKFSRYFPRSACWRLYFSGRDVAGKSLNAFRKSPAAFFSSEMENRCRRQMILLCVSFSQQSNGRILFCACIGYHWLSLWIPFWAIKIRLRCKRRRANGQFGLIEPFILDRALS